jgi:3-hydroxybutyryl-CoA dehydrogenase
MKKLSKLFARDVEKKRISAELGDEAMSRIKSVEGDLVNGSAGLGSDTDLVIEVRPLSLPSEKGRKLMR